MNDIPVTKPKKTKPPPHMIGRHAIQEAINAEGGRRALAARLAVTEQAVGQWWDRGWVPLARVDEFARLYGIDRRLLLKPDLAKVLYSS